MQTAAALGLRHKVRAHQRLLRSSISVWFSCGPWRLQHQTQMGKPSLPRFAPGLFHAGM